MSEPLVITIAHKLGKGEALRRVDPTLGKSSTSFPALKVEEKRSGPATDLDFRIRALGQVAAGNVQVGDDSVRVEVTLPWLLHKFGEAVRKPSPAKVKSCLRRNWKALLSASSRKKN
jgi:Putative polyhydroxyalkanoic acid system protein (PHA_gran_rgn)